MHEQTVKLLEQLAQKLGTTSEYLWLILIKQAPIESTVTLLQTVFILFVGWAIYKAHRKFMTKPNEQSRYEDYYDQYELSLVMPMIIGVIIWGIMAILYFACFSSIIAGYFNPEYWALDKILDSVKPHCKH